MGRSWRGSGTKFTPAPEQASSEVRRRSHGWVRVLLGLFALTVTVVAAYPLAIRPWHLRWGATDDEVRRPLPGDELLARPVFSSTRAITIEAPAKEVWPWLVQLGQGRGGFYSYDWLENLFGCDIHSADRTVPELQNLRVGDTIRLVPEPYVVFGRVVEGGPPAFTVVALETDRALILRPRLPEGAAAGGDAEFDASWSFLLSPLDERSTRLIVRWRAYSEPAWLAPVMGVEPIHFVMEQRMLRGIKERAERAMWDR